MTACIVGWAHTPFGKLGNETVESLIIKVANEAVAHAGIGPEDVDEILLGHFNAGFTEQDFTASIVLQANDAFRFKPATRVENACSTGTAAVREAIKTVEAQRAKSLFECAISRVYADSAVSGLSLEQALACKTGCPLLARSLWARFRQPRRQSFFGQAIGIPHSNRL